MNAYATVGVSLISGPGKLSGGAGGVFALNLGSVVVGGTAPAESLGIENTAKGQADLLKGTLALSGTTSAFTNNSGTSFTGVAAGSESTGHTGYRNNRGGNRCVKFCKQRRQQPVGQPVNYR